MDQRENIYYTMEVRQKITEEDPELVKVNSHVPPLKDCEPNAPTVKVLAVW